MTALDQYSLSTVPVEQVANGNILRSATAFVWKHDPQYFLITNWHVVTGRNAPTNKLETIVQPDTR